MLTNKIGKLFDELLEGLAVKNISINHNCSTELERCLNEVNELASDARMMIWTLAVMSGVHESTSVKNMLENLDAQELIKDNVALPIEMHEPDETGDALYDWAVKPTGRTQHRIYKPLFGKPKLVLQREMAQYTQANPRNGKRAIQNTWWEDADSF